MDFDYTSTLNMLVEHHEYLEWTKYDRFDEIDYSDI